MFVFAALAIKWQFSLIKRSSSGWNWFRNNSSFQQIKLLHLIKIFLFKVRDFWRTDGQEMCNLTLFMSAPFFYTAVFEFQIVRVWFALKPYQVLTHDDLSWPLAVSVPLFTGIEIFGFW